MADINGQSFIATLTGRTHGGAWPIGYQQDGLPGDDGWLIQAEHLHTPAVLRFDFIEEQGARLLYTLSAAKNTFYEGAKVGVSRNGYLGFYWKSAVTDPWKIELCGENSDPNTFNFLLRDHRGYRVGAVTEAAGGAFTGLKPADRGRKISYLNVEEGQIVYFQGQIISYP